MPRYHYKAVTPNNERQQGVLDAASHNEAVRLLASRDLVILAIDGETRASALWRLLNRDIALRQPLTARERAALTFTWGSLVDAGVTVEQALGLSVTSLRRKAAKDLVDRLREDVKNGSAMHEALGRQPGAFPDTYITLVRSAEAAGALGPTLRRMADDLAARRATVSDLRSALLYPTFLTLTASAAIAILLVVVVPSLESLIGDQRRDLLPAATRLVIAASHFLQDYGLLAVLCATLLLGGALATAATPGGRLAIDRLALRLPIIGSLLCSRETGRFMRTLGDLLGGGIPMARALPLSVPAISNRQMRRSLQQSCDDVLTGTELAEALARADCLPEDAVGLVRVGERTGKLDQLLRHAATIHEERAARDLKALTTLLTPVLTVAFGLLAGGIVYAMLSTILSVNELAIR